MTPEKNPNEVKMRGWRCGLFLVLCLFLASCKTRMLIESFPNGRDAQIYSGTPTQVEYGVASWYGGRWIGRLTANGETYRAAVSRIGGGRAPVHASAVPSALSTRRRARRA